MAKNTRYTTRFRRRREGKTNFQKRLELLKGKTERLVVRKTNTQILVQIIKYEPTGDKVLLSASAKDLLALGWKHSTKNTPSAYLMGMIAAKKAKENKIKTAILDIGLQSPLKGSKLFAVLKGAIDGGLEMNVNEKIYPSEKRISGEHISKHLDKSKNIQEDFKKIKEQLMN